MQKLNLIVVNNNLRKMVADARGLLHRSSTMSGVKAVSVRKRGMRLLDIAIADSQPKNIFWTSKSIAISTSNYVKENQLSAITAAVCFWVIMVFIIGFNN